MSEPLTYRRLIKKQTKPKTYIEHGDEPQMVAEAVSRALTAKSPRLRYPVGKGVLLSRLRRFAPVSIFDRAIRRESQLD